MCEREGSQKGVKEGGKRGEKNRKGIRRPKEIQMRNSMLPERQSFGLRFRQDLRLIWIAKKKKYKK